MDWKGEGVILCCILFLEKRVSFELMVFVGLDGVVVLDDVMFEFEVFISMCFCDFIVCFGV